MNYGAIKLLLTVQEQENLVEEIRRVGRRMTFDARSERAKDEELSRLFLEHELLVNEIEKLGKAAA